MGLKPPTTLNLPPRFDQNLPDLENSVPTTILSVPLSTWRVSFYFVVLFGERFFDPAFVCVTWAMLLLTEHPIGIGVSTNPTRALQLFDSMRWCGVGFWGVFLLKNDPATSWACRIIWKKWPLEGCGMWTSSHNMQSDWVIPPSEQ